MKPRMTKEAIRIYNENAKKKGLKLVGDEDALTTFQQETKEVMPYITGLQTTTDDPDYAKNIKQELDWISNSTHYLFDAVDAASEAYDEAQKAAADAKEALDELIHVEGEIDEIDVTLGTFQQEIDGMNATITGIETRVTTAEGEITEIFGEIDTINGTVTGISTQVSTNTADIITINGEIQTQGQTIDGLVVDVQTNTNSITSITGEIQTQGQTIDGLVVSVGDNTNNITSLTGQVQSNTNGVNDYYNVWGVKSNSGEMARGAAFVQNTASPGSAAFIVDANFAVVNGANNTPVLTINASTGELVFNGTCPDAQQALTDALNAYNAAEAAQNQAISSLQVAQATATFFDDLPKAVGDQQITVTINNIVDVPRNIYCTFEMFAEAGESNSSQTYAQITRNGTQVAYQTEDIGYNVSSSYTFSLEDITTMDAGTGNLVYNFYGKASNHGYTTLKVTIYSVYNGGMFTVS